MITKIEEFKKINENSAHREEGLALTLKEMFFSDTFAVTSDRVSTPWTVTSDQPEFRMIEDAIQARYKRATSGSNIEEAKSSDNNKPKKIKLHSTKVSLGGKKGTVVDQGFETVQGDKDKVHMIQIEFEDGSKEWECADNVKMKYE